MAEDKDLHGRGNAAQNSESEGAAPSRARNKTVMLSPEMTGQVRAMLSHETPAAQNAAGGSGSNPAVTSGAPTGKQNLDDYLPPLVDWGKPGQSASSQEGFVRAKGSSEGFSALDALVSDNSSTPIFDPLTTLAPSVTHSGSRADSVVSPFEHKSSGSGESPNSGFSLGHPTPTMQPPVNRAPQPSPFEVPLAQPQAAPEAPVFQPAPTARPARPQPPAGPQNWHGVVTNASGESSKLVGLLVSYDRLDAGEIFEVRSGRFLITSRPTDNGDYLLVDDETISPLHAIVRATKEGAIQVLDQLSEFGTGVQRGGTGDEEEISGGLATIAHGDVVRFGKRLFVVVAIPQIRPAKLS